LLFDRDSQRPRRKTPQESFEPSKIGPLQDGSLSNIPNPNTQKSPSLRNPREEFENRNQDLFKDPPRTQSSVSEDGLPVARPIVETEPDQDPVGQNANVNRNSPRYGDGFDENSRRRAPPPVSVNPARFSSANNRTPPIVGFDSGVTDPGVTAPGVTDPGVTDPVITDLLVSRRTGSSQIPLAPGVENLPKEWQDLPQNIQNQLRRLLPIYHDITGPNSNLIDQDPYIPPLLFDDGEPNPNVEDFLSDRDESLDTSQFEPPNRSKFDFLNLLMSLFNLILSLKADDIKGDDYEVVVFKKISDDEQREERTESDWIAAIREKEREIPTPFGTVSLGGREMGDFSVGDPFPVTGSEVSIQEIETEELEIAGEEEIEVAIKVILSNGEEILKAEPEEEE